MASGRSSFVGIFVLFAKLGPKLFKAFSALLKTAKLGKVGLAAGSMAAYSFLLSWQFAVMIMALLFVHESGHIWAMKKEGIKTKGIYFIPFFGAAAVADDVFPSRRAESYIAIMGPVWGLALSALALGGWYVTDYPILAGAASWMALINLFNLLPINPLDGGRIVKSVGFSINSRLGFLFLIIGMAISVVFLFRHKIGLFGIILIVGGLELLFEYKQIQKTKKLEKFIAYLKPAIDPAAILEVAKYRGRNKGCDALKIYRDAIINEELFVKLASQKDSPFYSEVASRIAVEHLQNNRKKEAIELWIWELSNALSDINLTMVMPRMNSWQIAKSIASYIIVAGLLFGIMILASSVPGAKIALEALK